MDCIQWFDAIEFRVAIKKTRRKNVINGRIAEPAYEESSSDDCIHDDRCETMRFAWVSTIFDQNSLLAFRNATISGFELEVDHSHGSTSKSRCWCNNSPQRTKSTTQPIKSVIYCGRDMSMESAVSSHCDGEGDLNENIFGISPKYFVCGKREFVQLFGMGHLICSSLEMPSRNGKFLGENSLALCPRALFVLLHLMLLVVNGSWDNDRSRNRLTDDRCLFDQIYCSSRSLWQSQRLIRNA